MKNKIFLGLILGIFLIGIVSASITGYLTARDGEEIREAGYTATLQKVEGTTAIVSVQTPTGATETVRVAEGGTAQVGEATISASSLKKGTLFTRSGANIELKTAADDVVAGPNPIGSGSSGIFQKHTHLIDYNENIILTQGSNYASSTFNRSTSRIIANVACPQDMVIVDTGFNLYFNGTVLNKFNTIPNARLPIMEFSYHDGGVYYLGFLDYNEVILPASKAYVYCAAIEKAVDAQTAHFPY